MTSKVHPRYLARMLEREGQRLGFSRSYRASLDRVGGITIDFPEIDAQTSVMAEVLSLEAEIAQDKSELESLAGKKATILNKYL